MQGFEDWSLSFGGQRTCCRFPAVFYKGSNLWFIRLFCAPSLFCKGAPLGATSTFLEQVYKNNLVRVASLKVYLWFGSLNSVLDFVWSNCFGVWTNLSIQVMYIFCLFVLFYSGFQQSFSHIATVSECGRITGMVAAIKFMEHRGGSRMISEGSGTGVSIWSIYCTYSTHSEKQAWANNDDLDQTPFSPLIQQFYTHS